MFTAAIFKIDKLFSPNVHQEMTGYTKFIYAYMMHYYLAIKK